MNNQVSSTSKQNKNLAIKMTQPAEGEIKEIEIKPKPLPVSKLRDINFIDLGFTDDPNLPEKIKNKVFARLWQMLDIDPTDPTWKNKKGRNVGEYTKEFKEAVNRNALRVLRDNFKIEGDAKKKNSFLYRQGLNMEDRRREVKNKLIESIYNKYYDVRKEDIINANKITEKRIKKAITEKARDIAGTKMEIGDIRASKTNAFKGVGKMLIPAYITGKKAFDELYYADNFEKVYKKALQMTESYISEVEKFKKDNPEYKNYNHYMIQTAYHICYGIEGAMDIKEAGNRQKTYSWWRKVIEMYKSNSSIKTYGMNQIQQEAGGKDIEIVVVDLVQVLKSYREGYEKRYIKYINEPESEETKSLSKSIVEGVVKDYKYNDGIKSIHDFITEEIIISHVADGAEELAEERVKEAIRTYDMSKRMDKYLVIDNFYKESLRNRLYEEMMFLMEYSHSNLCEHLKGSGETQFKFHVRFDMNFMLTQRGSGSYFILPDSLENKHYIGCPKNTDDMCMKYALDYALGNIDNTMLKTCKYDSKLIFEKDDIKVDFPVKLCDVDISRIERLNNVGINAFQYDQETKKPVLQRNAKPYYDRIVDLMVVEQYVPENVFEKVKNGELKLEEFDISTLPIEQQIIKVLEISEDKVPRQSGKNAKKDPVNPHYKEVHVKELKAMATTIVNKKMGTNYTSNNFITFWPEYVKNNTDSTYKVTNISDCEILNTHWVCIKDYDMMMNSVNENKHGEKYCRNCGCYKTHLAHMMESHVRQCQGRGNGNVCLPESKLDEEGNEISAISKFQNARKQIPSVYDVFADFESILQSMYSSQEKDEKTRQLQKHIPISVGVILVKSKYEDKKFTVVDMESKRFHGENCVLDFMNQLHKYCIKITKELQKNIAMNFTKEDEKAFNEAKECHICKQTVQGKKKVRDHDHLTGKYRGAAHSICNMLYNPPCEISCKFHNLAGYDGKFIIENMAKFLNHQRAYKESQGKEFKYEFNGIPQNSESLMSFSIKTSKYAIKFTDSFKFMNFSIAKLAETLPDDKKVITKMFYEKFVTYSNQKLIDNYRKICSQKGAYAIRANQSDNEIEKNTVWSNYWDQEKKVKKILIDNGLSDYIKESPIKYTWENDIIDLCKKLPYCYNYITSFDVLQEKELPDIKHFEFKGIDEQERTKSYDLVKKLWNKFNCKNLLDYQDLYMCVDITILADLWLNFRDFTLNYYHVEPNNYYSLPGCAYDAMMIICAKEWNDGPRFEETSREFSLELLTDMNMVMFFEDMKIGGISTVYHKRFAQANNKYMKNYDETKPTTYINYFDANSMYCDPMTKELPMYGYKWIEDVSLANINSIIDNYQEGQVDGCALRVKLSYPKELHDNPAHLNMPLCPNNLAPDCMTEYMADVGVKLNVKINNIKKLAPNLYDKDRLVISIQHLKFCLDNGMVLQHIYEGVTYKQYDWLKPFVMHNNMRRKAATNDFEDSSAKLYSNATFGKFIEDQRSHSNIKICFELDKFIKMNSRANYKNSIVINSDTILVDSYKNKITINKPIPVGATILCNSKLVPYKFWYDYIVPKYGNKASLIYGDTDSLILYIECEDVYQDMIKDKKQYDLSNFGKFTTLSGNTVQDNEGKRVIGRMKDEAAGYIITEVVANASKSYSYKKELPYTGESKRDNRLKGVSKDVTKKITHQQYKDVALGCNKLECKMTTFKSNKFQIYTTEITKTALNTFDNKRLYIDAFTTVPHGYQGDKYKTNIISNEQYKEMLKEHNKTIKEAQKNN